MSQDWCKKYLQFLKHINFERSQTLSLLMYNASFSFDFDICIRSFTKLNIASSESFSSDFGFEILCKKKLWFWKRIIWSCCLLGRKCWCLTRLAQTINWERNFLRRWGKSGQNENEFEIDHIHWLEVLNLLQHASRRFVFLRNLQPNLGHQFRKNLFTLKIGKR